MCDCGLSSLDPLWYLPKHAIENLMREYHGLINCVAGRNHTNVNLLLTRQSYPSDEARSQVDHPSIDKWHACVGVEHV